MKGKNWIIIGIIAFIVLVVGMGGCSSYNGMVTAEQEVENKWANVQNVYQERYDKIPNLVETVKGYAAHESETLQAVTNARAGVQKAYDSVSDAKSNASPENIADYQAKQDELTRAFSIYVNAVKEAYPDLKANTNFLALQDEISGIENKIATERKRYNDAVMAYNLKVKRFPGNIFAGIFGFEPCEPFTAEREAQKAPKVQF